MSWLHYEFFFVTLDILIFNFVTLDILIFNVKHVVGKLLRLSLGLMGHKIYALDFIFSDFLGPAPMFSFKGFCYFIIFEWFFPSYS